MTDTIHEYMDYADMDMDRLTQIVQERYWEEYREYISEMPMSSYERSMLRKWVSEGHSVYDDPGSRYLLTSCYPRPFLEVYREDLEITKALRGKNSCGEAGMVEGLSGLRRSDYRRAEDGGCERICSGTHPDAGSQYPQRAGASMGIHLE